MRRESHTIPIYLFLLLSLFATGIAQAKGKDTSRSAPLSTGQILQQTVAIIAGEIRSSVSGGQFSRVAVMPFTTLLGEENVLGLYISDRLTSELSVGEDNLQLVERSQINQALAEMRLGETGFLSEETIQKTGQALGADAVIVGSIVELGGEVDINLRVFSISTLKILGKASQLIEKNEVIESLLSRTDKSSQTTRTQSQSESLKEENITDSNLLFHDDCNRDLEMGSWAPKAGSWMMVDGAIAQNSSASPAFITSGDSNWRNYTLEVNIKGIEKWGPIIGVRYNDRTKQCIALNFSEGNGHWVGVALFNVETGKIRSLPGTKRFKLEMGRWYKLKMEVHGGTVKCYLNGQLIQTVSDPEIGRLRTGGLALGTWQSRAYFDEIKVTRIEQ